MNRWLFLFLAFALPSLAMCQDTQGEWVSISEPVTSKLKVGYPGKGTAGVAVDPATGAVFMVVSDQGLWKSTDQGASFSRIDNKNIGGRCETGFALNFDPKGQRLMCFMIYGNSASTSDAGKTWTPSKLSHLDFGAVDWEATGQCFLAIRHERGGELALTSDGGKAWSDLGKGFTRVGMFDGKTFVCGKAKGLVRSDDGGQTWNDVSDVTPPGYVMVVRDGIGYWPTAKGLLVSKDKGKTWAIHGSAVNAVHGPYWGKDSTHMIVVGSDGFHETTNGGKDWKKVAPLPKDFKVGGVGPNYAWDHHHNIFYASSMGKDTFRFKRKP